MQTAFTPAQLENPDMRESEKILRTCVHCGFCTATCPTYLLLGDELDSPRGRIYLIKDMFENNRPASPEIAKHIDRCLSCLACMTTCPSGVHYMHLVDHARAHIEDTYKRPWRDRAIRELLARILPYRSRFRAALGGAWALNRILALAKGVPWTRRKPEAVAKGVVRPPAGLPSPAERFGAMLRLAPKKLPGRSASEGPAVFPARATRRARVALLSGCAQPVLAPHINEAALRLLNRLGVEVVLAKGETCCGALVHHMGRSGQAHAIAARTIDAWTREIEKDGLDAIVITASGCGTTIKDYGFMFRDDPAYAEKAARVSHLAKDITEYLDGLGLPQPVIRPGLTVAYHSACSMQHGQKLVALPKQLLQRAGFKVKDVPEGHICCGSAGVYNILQPELAMRLRDRKVMNIEKTKPDLIATGNIGCMAQIGSGTTIPIVHTVELLDWATGGERPAALASLAARSQAAPAVFG